MDITIKITQRDPEQKTMDTDELCSFLDAVNAQIGEGIRSGIIGEHSWSLNYETN